jgi:cytochrome c peroxidase
MISIGVGLLIMGVLGDTRAQAQTVPTAPLPQVQSLLGQRVPYPPNLGDYIADYPTAVALGKAFFWDTQMGSDGKTACATCHFKAGTDGRDKNTLNPGTNDKIDSTNTFSIGQPNSRLSSGLFPFHRVDQLGNVTSDTDDVVGAQGVISRKFLAPGGPDSGGADKCQTLADPIYNVGGVDVRQVTGRNSPSVINAVYNFRNFWDGRAQNDFNGINPFGLRDTNPQSAIYRDVGGQLDNSKPVRLTLSSLASQAVGPPGNPVEMSCAGRLFPDMARKLLALKPLAHQKVSQTDSVLGQYASADGDGGLRTVSYEKLIKKAFQPDFWRNTTQLITIGTSSPIVKRQLDEDLSRVGGDRKSHRETDDTERSEKVIIPGNQYRQIEANFSLFWGLAIQAYESTLVSDQTPVDLYLAGQGSLTPSQLNGLAVFQSSGKCSACHGGAETTNASVSNVINERLERMYMGDNGIAVYDNGFYNTAVRRTREDIGAGGLDPFDNPLSEVGFCQAYMQKYAGQSCPIKNLAQNGQVQNDGIGDMIGPRPAENIDAAPLNATERMNADGAFKTPQLRNVELTGPYMHNGGMLTLRQVVDFYNRGGDFHDPNMSNLDPNITPLGLSDSDADDLVNFMLALTDPRVKYERAPFDHPALCVPNGEKTNSAGGLSTSDGGKRAQDDMQCMPAVGAGGGTTPIQPFLKADPHAH